MKARVMAGATPVPVSGMQLAAEVRSGGSLTFAADPDLAVTAATVWTVEVGDDTAGWTAWPTRFCPISRTRSRMGRGLAEYAADPLLAHWARHTVFYPEYDRDRVSAQSGTDRGLGWMMTAYDHLNDSFEAWDLAADVTRALPADWPAGSTAGWVTASASESRNRKLFRGNLTVGGTAPQLVKVTMSSDEGAALWLGGELLLQTSYTEEGKNYVEETSIVLWPGTYAVGLDTRTHVTKGGDGVDPVLLSVWATDAQGYPTTELWASSAATLRACRRYDEEDGTAEAPPGPTPGRLVRQLVEEAQARGTAGWDQVTLGFTDTLDSHGATWDTFTERIVRVGMDDYWQFLQALSETDCDVWMDGLTLHAAPKQGMTKAVTLDSATVRTASDSWDVVGDGSVILARSYAGWVQVEAAGFRLEKGLEVGTALSGWTAGEVAQNLLGDADRWDATLALYPGTGATPGVDFGPGDTVTLDYPGLPAPRQVEVLTLAVEVGEGSLGFQAEVTDV